MPLRLLAALVCVTAIQAAQPTLTTISTLPGGTEEQAYTITYDAVKAAADESGSTTRFKITTLLAGSLVSLPHGTSGVGTPVVLPFYLDGSVDVVWSPVGNANSDCAAFVVYANDGVLDSPLPAIVSVNLAPVFDPHTAHNGVNARTGSTARLVSVTEDTWTEFTFASLYSLTETTEVDGDPITYIITALGDGTLAKSSGGTALIVGDTIVAGESLWWLPSPDRFTKQGATAADDEAPVRFATITVRRTHIATNYDIANITLTSTIDGVDDAFVGTGTGFTPVTIVRGHSLTMTTEEWIAHIEGFTNTDRDATGRFVLNGAQAAGWKLVGFDPADPDTPVNEQTGFSASVQEYPDIWSVRLTPPSSLAVGTYDVGLILPRDPITLTNGTSVFLTIRIVEPTSGDGSGGGGGGCGLGSSLSMLGLLLVLTLGVRRTR